MSRVSHFRDLLSQLEREYLILSGIIALNNQNDPTRIIGLNQRLSQDPSSPKSTLNIPSRRLSQDPASPSNNGRKQVSFCINRGRRRNSQGDHSISNSVCRLQGDNSNNSLMGRQQGDHSTSYSVSTSTGAMSRSFLFDPQPVWELPLQPTGTDEEQGCNDRERLREPLESEGELDLNIEEGNVSSRTDSVVRILTPNTNESSYESLGDRHLLSPTTPRSRLGDSSSYVHSDLTWDCPKSEVFPIWWNPNKAVLDQMMMRRAVVELEQQSQCSAPARARCLLSPVAAPRVQWDMLAFLLILYDAWATPFQLLFGSPSLRFETLEFIDRIITIFFTIDIILNFNTGVVERNKISFNRCSIAKVYMGKWFWLDLLATFPFEVVDSNGSFTGFLRLLKALKALKTLRFFRLVSTLKSLQFTENHYFDLVLKSKHVMRAIFFGVLLLLNVHLFTCLWLALQADLMRADSFTEALYCYCDAYVSVYLATLHGSMIKATNTSPGTRILHMFIATEQVLILVCVAAYAIFEALILHGDAARARLRRDQTLRYMRRHQIATRTQVEVVCGLDEAGSVKVLQKDFIALSHSDLPEELQRKIAYELWAEKFKTLGLLVRISEWNDDFFFSLSLLCREEILASDAVLFREMDLSIAAYFILTGELIVSCPLLQHHIPSFGEGTWVGEGALVNPSIRRGVKAVTASLTAVMNVPSKAFQQLLQESNLYHHFEDLVRQEVWRGICGRCGSLGHHFFDRCPMRHVEWLGKLAPKNKVSRTGRYQSSETHSMIVKVLDDESTDLERSLMKDLVGFLKKYDILYLLHYLGEMNVYSLQELEELDVGAFITHLSKKVPPVEMTIETKRCLRAKHVRKFRRDIHKGVEQSMFSVEQTQHLVFLSHYKLEAGTEAALMRSELEQLVADEAEQFDVPFFLDSEDLADLSELQRHVEKSFNLVLLLTNGVLSRPWCLIEIVTAVNMEIPVILVKVDKPGLQFDFPTEQFYSDFLAGKTLDDSAKSLLSSCNMDLHSIETVLRKVFQKIAVPYSPHKSLSVRNAELIRLLGLCKFGDMGGAVPFATSLPTWERSSTNVTRPGIKKGNTFFVKPGGKDRPTTMTL